MNALEFLLLLKHEFGAIPMSTERFGQASNSEIRRWLQNKSIEINGDRPSPDCLVQFPIQSLVFFPKANRRTTLI